MGRPIEKTDEKQAILRAYWRNEKRKLKKRKLEAVRNEG